MKTTTGVVTGAMFFPTGPTGPSGGPPIRGETVMSPRRDDRVVGLCDECFKLSKQTIPRRTSKDDEGNIMKVPCTVCGDATTQTALMSTDEVVAAVAAVVLAG